MTTITTPPSAGPNRSSVSSETQDFDSVSGNLLEEYRENVYPARGQQGADIGMSRRWSDSRCGASASGALCSVPRRLPEAHST